LSTCLTVGKIIYYVHLLKIFGGSGGFLFFSPGPSLF
jgi:hypothetical protein